MNGFRILILIGLLSAGLSSGALAEDQQPTFTPADTVGLNYSQFALLAIQDGGRRKPIDTFARETLVRITGRSTYTDKAGRT